nr:RNA-directed DNA polymerase, eukaryota [Tanacetum cinerariifolium]
MAPKQVLTGKVVLHQEYGLLSLIFGLCSRYSRLFRLDINENCLLNERYIDGTWCWQWSRPIVLVVVQILFHSLLAELADVTLSLSPDLWKWNIGSDGSFSVASTRIHLDDLLLPSLASPTT